MFANWLLEPLETRLLLSSGAVTVIDGSDGAHPLPSADEVGLLQAFPLSSGFAEIAHDSSDPTVDVFAGVQIAPFEEAGASNPSIAETNSTSRHSMAQLASQSQAAATVTLEIGGAIKLTGSYTPVGDGSDGNPLATIEGMSVEFMGALAGWQTTTTISGVKLYGGAAEIPATSLAVTGSPGGSNLYTLSGGSANLSATKITFTSEGGARSGFAVVGGTSNLITLQAPRVGIAGVTLSGDTMTIGVVDGKFKATVPESSPLEFNIGTIIKVRFTGSVSAETVDLNGSASLSIGSKEAVGLNGTMTVKFSNEGGMRFAAAVEGGLYILDQAVATLSGSLSIVATPDTFKFGLQVKFDVLRGAIKLDVACSVELTPGGMNLSWDGSATLFGRWTFTSSGFVNSNGTWQVKGKFEIKQSIGNSFIGASISGFVEVDVSNTAWTVTLGGTAEGHAGPLRASITATAQISNDGTFVLSFSVRVLFWTKNFTLNVSIKDGIRIWSSELDGSVLFIDRNGDGIAQKDELGGVAGDSGAFSFEDSKLMQEFDTNADKKLQRAEIVEFFDSFEAYDKNGDGFLTKEEAKELIGNFGAMDLDGDNELIPKEVAFLTDENFTKYDTDKNGSLDDEETPFIRDFGFFDKDGDGRWAPSEAASFIPSLATFDKNADGVLSEDEADDFFGWYVADDGNDPLDRVMTVTGGRDKATGMDNPLILRALGGDYGEMAIVTPSPFSTLTVGFVEVGLDRVDAMRFIAEGLDIPPTVDPNTMDPSGLVGPLAPQANLILARAEQLTTLVVNGAALLQSVNPTLTTFRAQQAVWHGIALELYFTRVGRQPGVSKDALGAYDMPEWDFSTMEDDGSGNLVSLGGSATFSLANEANVRNIMQDAAEDAATELTEAQVDVCSKISSQMNGLINDFANSGVDVKTKLSRSKAVTQNGSASALRQLGSGVLSASSVLERYTGAGLVTAVAAVQSPISGPPVISPIANQATDPGKALSLPFDVTNVLGKASGLTFSVTSSNLNVVPLDGLLVSGEGQLRTLAVRPVEGRSGVTTITLTVTESGRSSSRSFQLSTSTFVISWASVLTHGGGLGEVPLAISADGRFTEPRAAGVTKLVIKFNGSLDPATVNSASLGMAGVTSNNNGAVDLAKIRVGVGVVQGNTAVEIVFSQSLPDQARYQIRLTGLKDASGQLIEANTSRIFTSLAGDANGDGVVTNTDIGGLVRLRSNSALSSANVYAIRSDVDTSGIVTKLDAEAVYPLRGHDGRFLLDPIALKSVSPVPVQSTPSTNSIAAVASRPFLSSPLISTSRTTFEEEEDNPLTITHLSLETRSTLLQPFVPTSQK